MDEFFRSNKLKFESLCVALLLSTAPVSADNLDSHAGYNYDLSDFVAWMEDAIREKEIPGVALAIVSREGIMHMQTWGVRSIDT